MPILILLRHRVANRLKRIFSATILISLTCFYSQAGAETLYKWVDKDGNVSYQEARPPKAAVSQQVIQTNDSNNNSVVSVNADKNPVLVYTIEDCDSCVDVLKRLRKFGVPVIESSLLKREAQARLLELGGQLAAPSVFIDDQLVNDFSKDSLITELESAGYILEKEDTSLAPGESPNRLIPRQTNPDN